MELRASLGAGNHALTYKLLKAITDDILKRTTGTHIEDDDLALSIQLDKLYSVSLDDVSKYNECIGSTIRFEYYLWTVASESNVNLSNQESRWHPKQISKLIIYRLWTLVNFERNSKLSDNKFLAFLFDTCDESVSTYFILPKKCEISKRWLWLKHGYELEFSIIDRKIFISSEMALLFKLTRGK